MSKNVLFVCSQNKLRSPTAEQIFAEWPGIEVASALHLLEFQPATSGAAEEQVVRLRVRVHLWF